MRAQEFTESFNSNLSLEDLEYVMDVIRDEAEEVNSASMEYDETHSRYKKLEKDYSALIAIENVIENNIRALKKPELLSSNIFMYDIDIDDILDGGVAAIHVSIHDNVAEIKWLGSYSGYGGKLMKSALELAKNKGATQVKVDAKWNSEGFYRKMGLEQQPTTEPDHGEIIRGSKLVPFKGKLEESEK